MDTGESKVLVANKALTKIGAKTITSFNDGSPNAVVISNLYDQCRQEVLEEHPWSFATNTYTLIPLTLLQPLIDFGDGVTNAYEIPPNFLSLYRVNTVSIIRFEVLQSPFVGSNTYAILSNINTNLIIKYIFDNDDPTTYTAKFIDSLACKIAFESCFKISEASQYASSMAAQYAKSLASSQSADSKGSSPDQPAQDYWINARLSGGTSVVGLPSGQIGFNPNPYFPDF